MRKILTSWALVMLMLLSSCSPWQQVQADGLNPVLEADELDEIKTDLRAAVLTVDSFVQQTQQGRNLSDMTIGLFVSNLLGQLGRQDTALSMHIHRGGRFVEDYLKDVFQFHPEQEIADIKALKDPGNVTVRQAAAAALECLRHIPNAKSPAAEQAEDRAALVQSLHGLKQQLALLVAALP